MHNKLRRTPRHVAVSTGSQSDSPVLVAGPATRLSGVPVLLAHRTWRHLHQLEQRPALQLHRILLRVYEQSWHLGHLPVHWGSCICCGNMPSECPMNADANYAPVNFELMSLNEHIWIQRHINVRADLMEWSNSNKWQLIPRWRRLACHWSVFFSPRYVLYSWFESFAVCIASRKC